MQKATKQPLFDTGQLVATPGALAALEKTGQNAIEFLSRHVCGDWGELRDEDKAENQLGKKFPAPEQLPHGGRRQTVGHYRVRPFRHYDSATRRILMHRKKKRRKTS